MGNFTELDMYLFGQATHYDIYKKLGAHPAEIRKKKGILFDVWAPHAAEVYVIGTFNDWNETANPMRFHGPEEHVVPQDLRLCGDPVMVTDGQKRIIPISQCQLVDGVPAADAERGVDVQASSVPLTGIRVGILDGHSLTPVLASKKMA